MGRNHYNKYFRLELTFDSDPTLMSLVSFCFGGQDLVTMMSQSTSDYLEVCLFFGRKTWQKVTAKVSLIIDKSRVKNNLYEINPGRSEKSFIFSG